MALPSTFWRYRTEPRLPVLLAIGGRHLQRMVTRKDVKGRVWGASQRISVDDALRICTMHGAYASFEEDIKGSLTAGKLADYVILEKDPRETDPDSIVDIGILRTVLGGRTTFEA
jgi:predicted amidohydrolase YtcJ